MGFFDEIGNKITGLGQESVKKTQNFTEVMKMNGEINEMEKGINAFYTEIGKIYYQKYAAESEDQEIIDYARKIEDNLKRIAILQAQIRNIKGIVKCKSCGADMDAKAIYCNQCGAKQVSDITFEDTEGRCPACGNVIAEGQSFCTKCGKKLEIAQQMEEKVEKPEERICPRCGSVLREGAVFCDNCGTRIGE